MIHYQKPGKGICALFHRETRKTAEKMLAVIEIE